MDEMKETLSKLTNAINAVAHQIENIEGRISNIEKKNTPEIPQELIDRLGVLEERFQAAESNDEITFDHATLLNDTPPITALSEQDLKEVSKLPDCVKELQVFEGNPLHYVSWIHSVEVILRNYEVVRNKPIYRAILQQIRQKVRGEADSALVSYNVFEEDWTEMKKILSLHYADKRDIHTLEHQLNQLMQRNNRLDEYYATVNHQLSLIINKIKTETYTVETVRVLIETYRNRALDVFIRGLNGDLSRLLMVQKPKTLPEAYSACLEIQNLNFRNHSIHMGGPNIISSPVNQMFRVDRRPFITRTSVRQHDERPFSNSWRQNNRFANNSQNRFSGNSLGFNSHAKTEPYRIPSSDNRNTAPRTPHPPMSAQKRLSRSENLPRKQSNLFHVMPSEGEITQELHDEVQATTEQNFIEGSSFPAYHV